MTRRIKRNCFNSGKPKRPALINSLYFNARSLVNKFSKLNLILSTKNYDLIFVTEIGLHAKIFNSSLSSLTDFNVLRSDQNNRGGGVAVLLTKIIPFIQIQTSKYAYFEHLCFEIIDIKGNRLRFVLIYLPPCYANDPRAIEVLCSQLFNLCAIPYPTFIVGDFNLSRINWDAGTLSTFF